MIRDGGPTPRNKATLGAVPLVCNIVYAGALVWAAVRPEFPEIGTSVPDVYAHAVAYGGQAGLLYWLLARIMAPLSLAAIACLGASGFGAVTEGLQLVQPERSTEAADLAANAVGAGCVVLVISFARGGRRSGSRS